MFLFSELLSGLYVSLVEYPSENPNSVLNKRSDLSALRRNLKILVWVGSSSFLPALNWSVSEFLLFALTSVGNGFPLKPLFTLSPKNFSFPSNFNSVRSGSPSHLSKFKPIRRRMLRISFSITSKRLKRG